MIAAETDSLTRSTLVGLIAATHLSVFAALLLNPCYRAEGPVVLSFTDAHGIHRGDILIVGGWLIGLIAVAVLLLERPLDSRPAAMRGSGTVRLER